MKNKALFLLLLSVFLSLDVASIEESEASSREFIPGCRLADAYLSEDPSTHRFYINEVSVLDLEMKDIRLVEGFGPNGEEALRISTGPQFGMISVRYYPEEMTKGKYRMSFSYKADLQTEDPRYGASVYLCGANLGIISFLNQEIFLEATEEWKKVECVFYFPYDSVSLVNRFFLDFKLGYKFVLEKILSSGALYFIDLKFEKIEE